jgi:general secretion pathway protein G
MKFKRNSVLSKQRGFTLIEIMVVVIIIGILISLVGTNVFQAMDEAEITSSKFQLKQIETSLSMYRLKNSRYPTSDQGLEALVNPPGGERSYMESMPKDAWGNDFQYRAPGQNGDYDLYSLGRDGQDGGEGSDADITNRD